MPSIYLAFKLLGGAYLLYLAYRIWVEAKQTLPTSGEYSGDKKTVLNSFWMGLVTQISNPKTALVIAGIFAAFVPVSPPTNTAIYVAIIAFVIDFSWYALVALTLSSEKSRSVYGRAKSNFDRLASVFLGIIGLKLILS